MNFEISKVGEVAKKELFKQVPDAQAFIAELEKNKFENASLSVELRDNATQDNAGQGWFEIVGEAFGPSGEKVATFREKISGRFDYNPNESKDAESLRESANQRLAEIESDLRNRVSLGNSNGQIATRPWPRKEEE